mmetsp:Transcript_30065/g.41619  ORF Transcript_30065/g.41619 Transcript_30065/m.41619 type:complete len:267 (-) Transcript_30065:347-1147(-)|eukprot:CAMPEP_0196586014 /NCGR_PEP_ID=MMETSP1081-20130531/52858_1 /TAXON_ID=36882 /ORGANISM="Pyramimonas amylifera, Strain CCMP720" /LENGTH=266 /DNA_ID=CAMNT_0041907749 /DNA_START=132 /DNA_END=932 /DNA_ORIENTATION=+
MTNRVYKGKTCLTSAFSAPRRGRKHSPRNISCYDGRQDRQTDASFKPLSPYQLLGVQPGCSLNEVKTAFKSRVKMQHPDLQQRNESDSPARAAEARTEANRRTARLLRAYQFLKDEVENSGDALSPGEDDPFTQPRGPVDRIFVNEINCLGRSCYASCVGKMPDLFQIAEDTKRARCISQSILNSEWEYPLFIAVQQCPKNCIHYVTEDQRAFLNGALKGAIDGITSLEDAEIYIYDMLAIASYENGRERKSKRTPKRSSTWVDWY